MIPSTEDKGIQSKGIFESRMALMSPRRPGLRTRGESASRQSRLVEECPVGTVPTYSWVLPTIGLEPGKENTICFSFSVPRLCSPGTWVRWSFFIHFLTNSFSQWLLSTDECWKMWLCVLKRFNLWIPKTFMIYWVKTWPSKKMTFWQLNFSFKFLCGTLAILRLGFACLALHC